MKKILTALALSAALAGCATSPATDSKVWMTGNTAMVEQQTVRLESNLWIDMMPKIGETTALVKEQTLHGALNLVTDTQLPADMDVAMVVLKQGDLSWEFEGDDFELRNHSENQWEVAFNWQLEVNITKPVDVAVQLVGGDKQTWVVNKQVNVDTVY
ncbi:hypothetical protein C9980_16920 [Vibrio mediterranei]|jgi:hypothetical protein|uniref:DNA polymerase III subunit beta n=1 Tax=Vibrio mediterranei TaxID=689 RepID=A0ABX5DEA0_9VIBR|nr:hypothetical protein [Vibrio mediterranei]MCG9657866.1 hypothetical protein [Vibrio mediterranei]MCG9665267.1 hypothetical protein [Vibrio mediterranei]PCD87937.1 hypothetical protein COR52_14385 [Vibrio mediterranei]PRQ67202.1 hypothetical protein COR51_13840 [Vibrio mediterranei]PTC03647.1 hypothetical protein C9980_16920 [Vibrio mediterranei]